MSDKYYERAKKGAAALDVKLGPDWEYRINLAQLNLADGPVCVLGQLFTDYVAGRDELFNEEFYSAVAQSNAHGFTISPAPGSYNADEWKKLTNAWGRLILRRIGKRFRR